MNKIILIGYMGSGKTTIGQVLAERTRMEHLDLDELVVAEAGKSIADIFSSQDEIYFRKIEHRILKDLVLNDRSFVLSLGGGTPCYANNHLFLNYPEVVSVYLKASVKTLTVRLGAESSSRPLLQHQDESSLSEFIAKHLFDRSYYYNQAHHKISVDDRTVTDIVQQIAGYLT